MSRRISVLFAFIAAILLSAVIPTKAEDYSNIRIVRLSFVEGNVQYRRAGEDWQAAVMNLPIQKGFAVRTGNGYAELEFENGLAVRLANNTSLDFTEMALVDGHRITRLTLGSGTAIFTANLAKLDELSVATPKFGLNVPRNGRFRVDVSATESWVTVFHGKVDYQSGAENVSLGGHQTMHDGGADLNGPQIVHSPEQDAFDKWVSQREQSMETARIGTTDYLQNKYYSTGFADLYDYGTWMDVPGYGMGWQPWGMGMGWMPYMDGMWSFMPMTGWNWLSDEPWGWLPYHFGGWLDISGIGWVWVPGGGDLTWQPSTANWIQVNNQMGWIPAAPRMQSSKPPKSMPHTLAPVAILAGLSGGGVIRAGGRMPVAGASTLRGFVPQRTFTAMGKLPMPTMNRGNGPAHGAMPNPIQGNMGLQGRMANGNAPASLKAPMMPNAGMRQGASRFSPPAMQAPRSMPAPPIARGAGQVGFGGRFPSGDNSAFDASRGMTGGSGTAMGMGSPNGGSVSPSHGAAGPAGGSGGTGSSGGGGKGGGGTATGH